MIKFLFHRQNLIFFPFLHKSYTSSHRIVDRTFQNSLEKFQVAESRTRVTLEILRKIRDRSFLKKANYRWEFFLFANTLTKKETKKSRSKRSKKTYVWKEMIIDRQIQCVNLNIGEIPEKFRTIFLHSSSYSYNKQITSRLARLYNFITY